jgi:hypothetical protein
MNIFKLAPTLLPRNYMSNIHQLIARVLAVLLRDARGLRSA